jgi:hypothetical protein
VVRGAAIFGIEKSTNKPISTMRACTRSYGVSLSLPFSEVAHNIKDRFVDPLTKVAMAQGQLQWLIKKGDVILSSEPKEATSEYTINFTETSPKSGSIQIYTYDEEDIDTLDRLSTSRNGLLKSSHSC